ncbi:hypothetical protein ML5_4196 [Micromonospora sp. L5]|mgnify:CR=1 FL=1|jgi:hypothetical protein|nr:hypothetical protein ML5_4196 [Micromonospora sp. L5]
MTQALGQQVVRLLRVGIHGRVGLAFAPRVWRA